MTDNNYETIDIAEDLVYQIIDPCRALSSSSSSASISIAEPPKNDERVRAGGVSARKCTLVIGKRYSHSARFYFFDKQLMNRIPSTKNAAANLSTL